MRIEADGFGESLGLPQEIVRTLIQSYACEFAVRKADGIPVTYPIAAYPGVDGTTLDVSVGLVFPWKAELARRDPRVCLSWCRPTDFEVDSPPIVVMTGHAAVRDRDLQGNTDRYLQVLKRTVPGMFGRIPGFVAKRLGFYLARIWVHVTPLRIWWWPDGDLNRSLKRWDAPDGLELPESDPPPAPRRGKVAPSRFVAPDDWRPDLAYALENLGSPIVTVLDDRGFPVTLPTLQGVEVPDGVVLDVPATLPMHPAGPACMTFHTFAFKGNIPTQQNRSFIGTLDHTPDGLHFRVQRQLLHGSLPGPAAMAGALYKVWRVRSRLPIEAERRGQPVPKVRP